ncbi:MAG: ABC transporter permease [Silvanigrellales bacterium]|nr:ABC transporter permease [Silvanigrellales bacterium]
MTATSPVLRHGLSHALFHRVMPPRLRRFSRHRVALIAAIYLALLGVIALGAPLLASAFGVTPDEQNILNRFASPGQVVTLAQAQKEQRVETWVSRSAGDAKHLARVAKANGWIPEAVSEEDAPYEILAKVDTGDLAQGVLAAAQDPSARAFGGLISSFEARHVLGTDELGRDVLARMLYGARVSLGVALLVGLCAGGVGLLVGCLSGFYGGWLDAALMRVTDALLTIPTLPLYIIFAAIDLRKIPGLNALFDGESQSVLKLVVILGGFTWMTIARVVRGAVLQVRRAEYVSAATSLGGSNTRILLSHVLPNILGPATVSVTLLMGEAMLIESGLSFLGLGIQPPVPSWGNMLQNALELVRSRPLLAVMPGVLIFSVIIAVNFIGDGLRDSFDPRVRAE